MILVDTSVWINHLRNGDSHLQQLLLDGLVVCHSFIIGELACGHLTDRSEILDLMEQLPKCSLLHNQEFLHFLERQRLWGLGLGFVDIHLLASARLDDLRLWTADKRLKAVSSKMEIEYLR